MADVFISYRRPDRVWAERISAALRDVGISSWRDTSSGAGEQFNPAIDGELKACRCVVVIWSESAGQSPWVQAEAQLGFERGILVATRVDDVKLSTPFSVVQTLDLRTAGVEAVTQGVQLKLGAPVVAPRKRRRSAAAIWSIICLVASFALAVVAALGAVEGDEINDVWLLGSWALGVIGVIALFQAISRRSSFVTVLGGGVLAAIAVTLSAWAWNTAEETTASYALAILPFAPGAALLTTLVGSLVRRRG
jgi:hypothetical protein